MANTPLDRFIARQSWLDRLAKPLQKLIGNVFKVLGPPGRVLKDVLHGTKPLGHPLHPAATDVPLGAWTVAVVLDIAYLTNHLAPQAADLAVFVGLLGAVLAAATGYTDFHETAGNERRLALVHGLTMTLTFVLYVVSFALRFWGGPAVRNPAIAVSFVGFALVSLGGYLGGHLVFITGTAVNRNAFAHPSSRAISIGKKADFPDGKPVKVDAAGNDVLVIRNGETWSAIGAICSHAGGPLVEGELSDGQIVCPWHASVFDVATGEVCRGPATVAQPSYEVTVVGQEVSVRCLDPL